MRIAMTKVVLKVVSRAFGDAQIGDSTKVLDLVAVPFPAFQEVNPHVCMGLIERPITDKTKPMA
jgi:hypothetical protein